MNITFKVTNYQASEHVTRRAQEKFGSLSQLLGKTQDTGLLSLELSHLVGKQTGDRYRAEANLDVTGKLYRATAEAGTMETAIDSAAGELRREINRDKGRARRMMRSAGKQVKSWLRFGRP